MVVPIMSGNDRVCNTVYVYSKYNTFSEYIMKCIVGNDMLLFTIIEVIRRILQNNSIKTIPERLNYKISCLKYSHHQ